MKYSVLKLLPVWIFILALTTQSCIKETYDLDKLNKKVEINPRYGLPLVSGTLSFSNLIPTDDTLFKILGDSINFVYVIDTLFSFDVSKVFNLEDKDIGEGIDSVYKLGSVGVDSATFNQNISLRQLTSNNNVVASNIEAAKTFGLPLPGFTFADGGTYSDEIDNFSNITLESGTMTISFTNNMHFTISSITLQLTDQATFNETLVYTNLAPGTTKTNSFDLAGKTIGKKLYFVLSNIVVPGGESTSNIDFDNDKFIISATVKNLVVASGTAKFDPPAPFENSTIQKINIPDKPDIELHSITMRSGSIKFDISNNIGVKVFLELYLPGSTDKNGQKLDRKIEIFPRTHIIDSIDFTKATIDLTNDGQTHSTINIGYKVWVDTAQHQVTFTNHDSIAYKVSFSNFQFQSVQGYFGQEKITQDSSMEISMIDQAIFDKFEGTMKLADPKIQLGYTNSFGIPVQLDIKLETQTKNGVNKLNATENLRIPASATAPAVTGALVLDKADGLDNILSFPPPSFIDYKVEATTNASGKTFTNFISYDSKISLSLNIDIPLSLNSSGFAFVHEQPYEMPQAVIDVDYAYLNFNFVNDFPFNLRIKITPYDSIKNITYNPVLDTILLKASEVNSAGVTVKPSTYGTRIGLTKQGFEDIKKSNKLIIRATFDTKDKQGITQNARILTSYKLKYVISVQAGATFIGDPTDLFNEDN